MYKAQKLNKHNNTKQKNLYIISTSVLYIMVTSRQIYMLLNLTTHRSFLFSSLKTLVLYLANNIYKTFHIYSSSSTMSAATNKQKR